MRCDGSKGEAAGPRWFVRRSGDSDDIRDGQPAGSESVPDGPARGDLPRDREQGAAVVGSRYLLPGA